MADEEAEERAGAGIDGRQVVLLLAVALRRAGLLGALAGHRGAARSWSVSSR